MDERPPRRDEDTIVSGAVTASAVQIAVYVLGFVTSALIARGLGPAGRGEYYLPVTAGLTAMAVMQLSMEGANTFFFAERRISLSRLARNVSALALVAAPIGIVLMFVLYAAGKDSVFEGVRLIDFAIAAAVLPLQLHLLWFGGILQLAKRLSRAQQALLAGAAAQFGVVGTLTITDGLTVTAVLVSYAVSIAVPWALQLRVAHRLVGIRPRFDISLARPVLGFALKLHVGMVFGFLLLRADVFLVGYYLDSAAVGIYSLAVIFAELGLTLTAPLMLAALPYQSAAGMREAGHLTFRVARMNALIALGLAIGFASTLWLGIPLVYGSSFEDAYGALTLLLPGIVALALARPLVSWLVRQDRPGLMAAVAFGAFAMNLALNALLIPAMGITGASVASSVSYVAYAAAFAIWGLRVNAVSAREALLPRRAELGEVGGVALRYGRRLGLPFRRA